MEPVWEEKIHICTMEVAPLWGVVSMCQGGNLGSHDNVACMRKLVCNMYELSDRQSYCSFPTFPSKRNRHLMLLIPFYLAGIKTWAQ